MARSKNLYSVSGRLGITAGMDAEAPDDISEDSDGNPSTVTWIVDLSQLLSEQLGKQMSMMSVYRVKGFRIDLRNVDDTNDNDYGITAGGMIQWYSPTRHRIDALQHAREYYREKAAQYSDNAILQYAPWVGQKKYKGLRFNWSADTDSVEAPTADLSSVLAGNEFSMAEILDHYNKAIGGTPEGEGYVSSLGHTSNDAGEALWITRTGVDQTDDIYWQAGYRNKALFDDTGGVDWHFDPESMPFNYQTQSGNHHDVLSGLIRVTLNHTNTNNPRATHVDDDYNLQMSILVEGWEGF